MTITPVFTPFTGSIGTLSKSTPFTHRDNNTFQRILYEVIQYINTTLQDEMSDELTRILTEAQTIASRFDERVLEWDAFFSQFIIDVTANIATLNDMAIGDLVDSKAGDTFTAINALIGELAVLKTTRGVANGVATLDAGGKVPGNQLTPGTLFGAYGVRPAANTVRDGVLYYASDTKETYRSSGVAWALVGKGGYLGSAELVTQFETSSTVLVDVPGLSVTFIAGQGSAKMTLSGECDQTVNNGMVALVAQVNGADGAHVTKNFPVPNQPTSFSRVKELTGLTPGEVYTVKVKMLVGGTGGFGKLMASTYNPVSLIVEAM